MLIKILSNKQMQETLKKAQSLVEKTKLQASIASKTVKMDSLFEELGKAVYSMECECVMKNEKTANIMVELQATELEIQALTDQVNALSNKVRCEGCGKYFDAEMSFCGHCGTKKAEPMPVVEDEELADEESSEVTEEVKEEPEVVEDTKEE